jgi:hypothetical protein
MVLILREARPEARVESLRVKLDPGSKTSGIAVINDRTGEVVWAAELTHRSQEIRQALIKRAAARRGRRVFSVNHLVLKNALPHGRILL